MVSDRAFESDDPFDLVESNISFVNALREALFRDDEIAPGARLSYWVDYYLGQVNNGGFSQFVYNSGWNEAIVCAVRDGLAAMGAAENLALFERGAAQVDSMRSDELSAYLSEAYFGENARRDALNEIDDAFYDTAEREDLVALNAAWLRSLPELAVLSVAQMRAEIDRLVGLMVDRAQRIAAARAAEPDYLKRIRALCDVAGQELSRVTAGDPSHLHDGVPTLAWHFLTDLGHHYMVEVEGGAIMFNGTSHAEVARVEG